MTSTEDARTPNPTELRKTGAAAASARPGGAARAAPAARVARRYLRARTLGFSSLSTIAIKPLWTKESSAHTLHAL